MDKSRNGSKTESNGIARRRRRRHRDASQWRSLIEQHRTSGQTVRAFCAKHGLGEGSFYAWRRRLRQWGTHETEASSPAAPADPQPARPAAGFVRLDAEADASGEAIEVRFASGATLRCSPSHLTELVRLLKDEGDDRC